MSASRRKVICSETKNLKNKPFACSVSCQRYTRGFPLTCKTCLSSFIENYTGSSTFSLFKLRQDSFSQKNWRDPPRTKVWTKIPPLVNLWLISPRLFFKKLISHLYSLLSFLFYNFWLLKVPYFRICLKSLGHVFVKVPSTGLKLNSHLINTHFSFNTIWRPTHLLCKHVFECPNVPYTQQRELYPSGEKKHALSTSNNLCDIQPFALTDHCTFTSPKKTKKQDLNDGWDSANVECSSFWLWGWPKFKK